MVYGRRVFFIKNHLIDEQKLLFYVIVSLQNQTPTDTIDQKDTSVIPQSTIPALDTQIAEESSSKIEVIKDYFTTIKTAIEDDPELKEKDQSPITSSSTSHPTFNFPDHIQQQIDTINQRIKNLLPDSNIQFPIHPIFLTMKFLDKDTNDLLNTDLTNLMDSTASDAVIRDDSS